MGTFKQMLSKYNQIEQSGFDPFTETYSGRMKDIPDPQPSDNLDMEDIRQVTEGRTDEPGLEMTGVRNLPGKGENMTVDQRDNLRKWWMQNKARKRWGDVQDELFGGHKKYKDALDMTYDIVSDEFKGVDPRRNPDIAEELRGQAKNKWAEAVRDIPEDERIKLGLPDRETMYKSGGISEERKQNILNNK